VPDDVAADGAADDGDDFGLAVARVVRSIPAGRVMTYGDVAAALGSRASRAVGKVMAHEGSDLPWWRVLRAGGLPPARHEARALEQYRAEGTPLVTGRTSWRVDLRAARWSPDADGRSGTAIAPGAGAVGAEADGYDPSDPNFPRDPF
jgi:alkylated DNA nucleotide flippase Atl1